MTKWLGGVLALAVLAGCSGESSQGSAGGDAVNGEGTVSGPFPKTITGTIGSSFPLEDGSGRIYLSIYELGDAAVIVSSDTYDAKGMAEEDAEFSLTIEPMTSEACGDAKQCFKGY